MAASRTTLLLALTGSTALAAGHPALAACTNTGGDNYACSGAGDTIALTVNANGAVDVAGGTTATGNTADPMFNYLGAGTLTVGSDAYLSGGGQSVATGTANALLQVNNAGTLVGDNTIRSQGRLNLTNAATGTISGANAITFNWLSQITNNGTIQGAIMGNEGEVTNNGTLTGNIDLIYGVITNSGTINGAARGWANNIISNTGTGIITGEVRVDGNGAWDLNITNAGRMESTVRATGKGTLSNSGTIVGAVTTAGAVNLDNSGSISGAVQMEVNGAGGSARDQTITNRGILQSTLTARGDTTLDNQGAIVGAVALDSGATRYTVSNSGQMYGGLRASSNATVTNATSGLITNGINLDSGTAAYTVTNNGIINGGLASQGSLGLTNATTGIIANGVTIGSAASTITNNGAVTGGVTIGSAASTITNNGTVSGGVSSQGRLNLTNAATGVISGTNAITFNWLSQIVNNGTIQGAIMGNEGEVTNNGTLTGNIDLIYGMITNSGTINGAARGWANNILSNAATGTITGEVWVDGNGAWDLGITNAGRMESTVRATGKGTLSNSGTIVGAVTTAGAVNLDNSGTIGGAVRMEVNGAGGSARAQTITNRGTLQSTLYARGDTTLDNRGTIVGAVTLDSGANSYSVTNSGRMESSLTIASAAWLDNSGTILGPVQLAGAYSTVVVRPGAVFGDTVSATGGSDTLLLDGPGSGSLDLSRLQGFERTEMMGGDWTLGGSLASLLTVNRGVVRGTGTFNSIMTLNNSTLAPGTNGSGVLTANGNVWLGSSSLLLIELNGASNSMLRATGTVGLDGTLSVNALNGMRKGQYVLIDAGSLIGDFDQVLLPTGPWRQSLTRNGGQLVLDVDVLALQSSAGGGVASTLEGLRGGGGAEITRIIDTVSMMPAAEQARVVASMTPERQAGTPTVMTNQVNFFQGAVQNRVAQVGGTPRGTGAAPIQLALAGTHLEGLDGTTLYAGQSRWSEAAATGAWVAPWGGVARQKEGGGATGWNSSSGGIAIGADTSLGKDLMGGAAAGWGRTDVTYGGVGGDSGTEVLVGSLYGAWTPSPWSVDAGLTVALSRFDTTRKVLAGAETRIARSDYAGRTVAASLGGKRRFDADRLEISPDARLTATRWWLDGYDESGAGALNLQVDGRSGNRLRAETGVELATSIATESGRVRPWLRLAAAHDWTSGSRTMLARFAGTAAGFTVDGKDDAGLRWLPGAGLSLDLSESVEASLEYQAEMRHDFQAHTGQVALRYRF